VPVLIVVTVALFGLLFWAKASDGPTHVRHSFECPIARKADCDRAAEMVRLELER
jgi:hypothetical protein